MGDIFVNNLVAIIGLPIIGFLAHSWISEIKERVNKLEKDYVSRFSEFNSEVNLLTAKITNVLDTVLTKFSHWEDRINKILEDVVVNHKDGIQELDFDSARARFDKFGVSSKRELNDLKNQVGIMKRELGDIDSRFKHYKKENKQPHTAFKMSELEALIHKTALLIGTTEDLLHGKVDRNNNLIMAAYRVMISFNKANKELELKVQRLIDSGSSRIILTEGKKKKDD